MDRHIQRDPLVIRASYPNLHGAGGIGKARRIYSIHRNGQFAISRHRRRCRDEEALQICLQFKGYIAAESQSIQIVVKVDLIFGRTIEINIIRRSSDYLRIHRCDRKAGADGSGFGGVRLLKYGFDVVISRIGRRTSKCFALVVFAVVVLGGLVPVVAGDGVIKVYRLVIDLDRKLILARHRHRAAGVLVRGDVAAPASDRRRRLGDLKAADHGLALYRDAGRVGARQGGRGRAEILAGHAVLIIDFNCRDLRAAPGGLFAGFYRCVIPTIAVRCVFDFKPHRTAVILIAARGGHRTVWSGAFCLDHLGRCGELPIVVVAVEPDRSVLVLRERVPFVRHVGGEDALIILHRLAGGNDRAGFTLRGDADFGRGVQGSFDGDGLARGQEHIVIEGANRCAVVIDVFIVAGDAYLTADGEGAGVGGADMVFVIAQIHTVASVAGNGAAGHDELAAVHIHTAAVTVKAAVARDLTAGHIKYGAG